MNPPQSVLYYLLQKWDETSIAILFSSYSWRRTTVWHTITPWIYENTYCLFRLKRIFFSSYFIGYLISCIKMYSSWKEKKKKKRKAIIFLKKVLFLLIWLVNTLNFISYENEIIESKKKDVPRGMIDFNFWLSVKWKMWLVYSLTGW